MSTRRAHSAGNRSDSRHTVQGGGNLPLPRPSPRPHRAVARAAAGAVERLEGRTLFAVTPAVSIGDVYAFEGNSGSKSVAFPVTLSAPSDQMVTVQYATVDDEAVAPADYLATSGTVVFAPGVTQRTVPVTIVG